jgi:hypothetical protein
MLVPNVGSRADYADIYANDGAWRPANRKLKPRRSLNDLEPVSLGRVLTDIASREDYLDEMTGEHRG